MAHQMNRTASPAEIRSWDASLAALAADLEQADLGGVEVLVEYQLPLSSKRVDVVLAGEHPRRGGPSYVAVELKQWTQAELFEGEPELVVQPTYGPRPVLHPVAPGHGYWEYMLYFLGSLHGTTVVLSGAAYLHNATDERVGALRGYPQNETGRLFTGQDRGEFMAYLRGRLAPGAARALWIEMVVLLIDHVQERGVRVDAILDARHDPRTFLLETVDVGELETRLVYLATHAVRATQAVAKRHAPRGTIAELRSYIDEHAFARAGIRLDYIEYAYPPYVQLHPPYDGAVSIIDTIAMTGSRAIEHACADGCRWYSMGESRPGSSLARFKAGFGAIEIPYSTYLLERMPISRIDAAPAVYACIA